MDTTTPNSERNPLNGKSPFRGNALFWKMNLGVFTTPYLHVLQGETIRALQDQKKVGWNLALLFRIKQERNGKNGKHAESRRSLNTFGVANLCAICSANWWLGRFLPHQAEILWVPFATRLCHPAAPPFQVEQWAQHVWTEKMFAKPKQ